MNSLGIKSTGCASFTPYYVFILHTTTSRKKINIKVCNAIAAAHEVTSYMVNMTLIQDWYKDKPIGKLLFRDYQWTYDEVLESIEIERYDENGGKHFCEIVEDDE